MVNRAAKIEARLPCIRVHRHTADRILDHFTIAMPVVPMTVITAVAMMMVVPVTTAATVAMRLAGLRSTTFLLLFVFTWFRMLVHRQIPITLSKNPV